MILYNWIKYQYKKKKKYINTYIQDLIAEQSNYKFKPYNIKLLEAYKNKSEEFNHFIFKYNGVMYELKNKKLKTISNY